MHGNNALVEDVATLTGSAGILSGQYSACKLYRMGNLWARQLLAAEDWRAEAGGLGRGDPGRAKVFIYSGSPRTVVPTPPLAALQEEVCALVAIAPRAAPPSYAPLWQFVFEVLVPYPSPSKDTLFHSYPLARP